MAGHQKRRVGRAVAHALPRGKRKLGELSSPLLQQPKLARSSHAWHAFTRSRALACTLADQRQSSGRLTPPGPHAPSRPTHPPTSHFRSCQSVLSAQTLPCARPCPHRPCFLHSARDHHPHPLPARHTPAGCLRMAYLSSPPPSPLPATSSGPQAVEQCSAPHPQMDSRRDRARVSNATKPSACTQRVA